MSIQPKKLQKEKQFKSDQNDKKKITIEYMTDILDQLKKYSIPYLIFIVVDNTMDKILKKLAQLQQEIQITSQKQMPQIGANIVAIANQLLPNFIEKFTKCYNELDVKKLPPSQVDEKYLKKCSKDFDNFADFDKFHTILKFIIEYQTNKQLKKVEEVNKMKTQFKNFDWNHNYSEKDEYQEVAINWIRNYFNQIPTNSRELMCCRMCFYSDMQILTGFKRISMISQNLEQSNEKQMEELAKIICSYLNTVGGVIVCEFDFKNEIISLNAKVIKGTPLTAKQQQLILNYIQNSLNIIKPKHKYFQKIKTNKKLLHGNSKQIINYYIEIEFIPVLKKEKDKEQDKTLKFKFQKTNHVKHFVCKIYVKKGHPRYFYYILEGDRGVKQKIRFYLNQGEKGKTIQNIYSDIYKKFESYQTLQQIGSLPSRGQLHADCIIDMAMDKDHFIIDETDNDSDDD